MQRRIFGQLLVAGALAISAGVALAQPANTIVVGFAAGGSVDGSARILANKLQEITGETYIVENRLGAAGRIAVTHTQRAEPDGHTLMLVPHGPMTLFPYLFTNLGFDPATDFSPISRVATLQYALVAGNDVPVKNGADLKKWATENPDKASFGSPGTGTIPHFIGEAVAKRLGVKLTNVPYKGSALTAKDIAAGVIPLGMMPVADALPLSKAGRLKIVATSGSERWPLTPDLPTMKEVGIDFVLDGWYAVYGPAGMEAAKVDTLNAAIRKALEDKDVIERFATIGLVAAPSTPAELSKIMVDESKVWGELVKETGFKPLD